VNRNRRHKFYVISLFVFIIISATIASANNLPKIISNGNLHINNSQTKWTVMIYFAGDHHRGNEIEYTQNILTDIGSNNDVNIVGLFDGKTKDDTHYYFIDKDLMVPLSWYETESNMAEPSTFERFLKLSMYNYPAEHYALFTLSAWGSGWQGIFSDTSGTGSSKTLDLITMPEISNVLADVTDNGTNKIDIYAIDVCLPGMIEVACQITPYVKYMVANEEHGFGGPDEISDEGTPLEWNYSAFLKHLHDNPDMTPEEFAIDIVNTYQPGTLTSKLFSIITAPKWYPIVIYHTDLSATNLTKLNTLETAVDNLADTMIKNLNQFKNNIKQARSQTREYGKAYRRFYFLPAFIITLGLAYEPFGYDCFIDLYNFAENLLSVTSNNDIKNACQQVMNKINTTIIANKACIDDHSNGLSIYFPEHKCQYDQSIWKHMGNPSFDKISPYEELFFTEETSWDEFLKLYLNI